MILADTGPIVALLDRTDPDFALCNAALEGLRPPLVTTWPAFTEAMFLLWRSLRASGQHRLWDAVDRGFVTLIDLDGEAIARSAELMEKYADLSMDLADATLVAVAEQTGQERIFTLDSDFTVYRRKNGKSFTLIP